MFRRPVIPFSVRQLSEREIGDSIAVEMVKFLKEKFLARAELPLPLDSVLSAINEFQLPEDVKTVLVKEVIPENPRIELVDGQVSYIPPLQIQNEADLKRIIQEKALRHEGVFEDDVLDSVPCGATMFRAVQMSDSVITVQRMDEKKVLFGVIKDDLSTFELDEEIKSVFQSVDTRVLDVVDIGKYLERNNLNPIQSERKQTNPSQRGRKQTLATPRKVKEVRIKDNQHVQESLDHFQTNENVPKVKQTKTEKKKTDCEGRLTGELR